MNLEDVPRRVFLDTCVVNFMLDHGAAIHDGETPSTDINAQDVQDINALRNVFLTGQRAGWQLAVSPFTYAEIARTKDFSRLSSLHMWFQELWQYWRSVVASDPDMPTFIEADEARVQMLISEYLRVLPDIEDRVLICDALVYRCNLFCTRDRRTILKHRDELSGLPFEIVTPIEWWKKLQPIAGLFA